MMAYSWISFGGLFYSMGPTMEYLNAIDSILICAVQNDLQEVSYYGNTRYIDNTWKPTKPYLYGMLYDYSWWWYVIIFDLLTAGLWEIFQIPANIVTMVSLAATTDYWVRGLRKRSCL